MGTGRGLMPTFLLHSFTDCTIKNTLHLRPNENHLPGTLFNLQWATHFSNATTLSQLVLIMIFLFIFHVFKVRCTRNLRKDQINLMQILWKDAKESLRQPNEKQR